MHNVSTSAKHRSHLVNLFEPDILVSYEYSRVFRRTAHFSAEQRLMFAVLADAIECFQRYHDAKTRRHRALYHHAETWIMNRDHRAAFSFENICDSLEINPAYVRQGLLQWRVNQEGNHLAQRRFRAPLRYQNRVRHAQVNIQSSL
jgi:hypothetical protein